MNDDADRLRAWLEGGTSSAASDLQIAALIESFQARAGRELGIDELAALFHIQRQTSGILRGSLRVLGQRADGEFVFG